MTGIKVVDASAFAALLFGEKEAEAVAASLGDARLAAPALLSFELANVCLSKMRRHPGDCRKIGGQAAWAMGWVRLLADWNLCPKLEPSVPL